jgi:hypothetical protein
MTLLVLDNLLTEMQPMDTPSAARVILSAFFAHLVVELTLRRMVLLPMTLTGPPSSAIRVVSALEP